MSILGIETTCDETAAGILDPDGSLQANQVHSQARIHANYGGIVPEVASRQHVLTIREVIKNALNQAQIGWEQLTAIAVANGPGLAGSLLVGVSTAKALAAMLGKPLIGVNHIEAHIAAAWISSDDNPRGRELYELAKGSNLACLVASGGHTEIIIMTDREQFRIVGQTRDDAVGEAFDKVARLLGLRYPGGPEIQRVAEEATGTYEFKLPRKILADTLDFSFSGIKTAVSREVAKWDGLKRERVADVAAEFQSAAVDVLVSKLVTAAERFNCSAMVIAGGVAANKHLRQEAERRAKMPLFMPPIRLCTDNGSMIASRGRDMYSSGVRNGLELDAFPRLSVRIG